MAQLIQDQRLADVLNDGAPPDNPALLQLVGQWRDLDQHDAEGAARMQELKQKFEEVQNMRNQMVGGKLAIERAILALLPPPQLALVPPLPPPDDSDPVK